MSQDNRISVKTTFYIYADARGVETILPTPAETANEVNLIEEKIAEQTKLLQSAGTDTRQEIQARLDMFAGLLESTKAIRDHYLPKCEMQDFYLLRPTQKQMNDCRTHPSVRIEKKDGTVHFDQDAFKEQLLIKCLEGKTREEVLALPPDVYERLFAELWKVCYPNAADLPFTKARLSPP